MSLQYIIDAYNIINHPQFNQQATKTVKDTRLTLLEFIRTNSGCQNPRNKISVVFDGYSELGDKNLDRYNMNIIFSRRETADEMIKRMVERSANPKNMVVVSDDKEIRLFIKAMGARPMGVEEFIAPKQRLQMKKDDLIKVELTYTQIQKINQELKNVWLR